MATRTPRPRHPAVLSASTRQRRRSRVPALVALLCLAGLIALAVTGPGRLDDLLGGPVASSGPAAPSLAPAAPAEAAQTPVQEALGPLPDPVAAGLPAIDLERPVAGRIRLTGGPRAGIAFDMRTGEVLWRKAATRALPIASLTKLMTALVAVERLEVSDRVRVTAAAPAVRGSQMGGLVAGRDVRTDVLLQGLMIASGNDAAIALAVGAAGSQREFVRLMNRKARRLGLRCTRFVDPHGLSPGDRSCPVDLAVLAMRAMAEPRIAEVAGEGRARVWPGAGKKRLLLSTNPLLQRDYPGTLGLKTGYTPAAGRCLVSVVRRGGRDIGVVVLGSPDPGTTTRRLLHRVTGI